MKAKLVFITGSKSGTSVVLNPVNEYTVGRSTGQTVKFQPDEILVSSKHATITFENDRYIIRDVGSRNGTFVNRERVTEHELKPGDMIEFGPGGPSAQFVESADFATMPTLDLSSGNAPGSLLEAARMRAGARNPEASTMERSISTTREFVALAYTRSSKRTRVTTIGLGIAIAVGIGGVLFWQERNRADLQSALDRFAMELESERGSRSALEANLASVQTRYDSLLDDVEESQQRVEQIQQRAASSERFIENVTRQFSPGVALIVSSYGFVQRGGTELLRFQVDASGNPVTRQAPDGRTVPRFAFGGPGPPLARQGSATGFLIDQSGYILTNKHVAEPWSVDDDIGYLRANGLDVVPRFIVLQAYFPPGDRSTQLVVEGTSDEVDIALLRALTPNIGAPVLPISAQDRLVSPGERIVFMGYPTGVHNLLFRIDRDERAKILNAVGEDPVSLARELARRKLIQPLIIDGAVSDTTGTELIHTADATGGGSGGPLFGADQTVVGIHYAAVRSPIQGDPFQTQRGVHISFAWSILPSSVQTRISQR